MKRLVLDLETKRSFNEVGGARNTAALGVSVVGVYVYDTDSFEAFREGELGGLEPLLRGADEIIGFNLIGFDWPVLAAEMGDWVRDLPTLDLMFEAQKALGHRVSLDSIAQATLGAAKLGSGLDALEYYAQGDWAKLERYCLEDVKLTRDIYEYAKANHHLYFQKGSRRAPIPMSFTESPWKPVFTRAARERGSVRIVYKGKERVVDVTSFDGLYIKGFDHLRQADRTFRLDSVDKAEPVASSRPLF
ncbi:MAG: ribonuclease H-like domain-containing protein [Trueperaceae bacterium]|nr:ribonuclease H-like domain-containing protein [Trueperaceae bacterium]